MFSGLSLKTGRAYVSSMASLTESNFIMEEIRAYFGDHHDEAQGTFFTRSRIQKVGVFQTHEGSA